MSKEFKKENMIDLVVFCGGDESLVDKYITSTKAFPPATIDELKKYPFKTNKDSLYGLGCVSKLLEEFVSSLELDRFFELELDYLIELIEMEIDDEDELEELISEIIRIKFGSVVIDW